MLMPGLALLAGAFLPALIPTLVSADTYYPNMMMGYPYNNCNGNNGYQYNGYQNYNYNTNYNCNTQGTVTIYTQVNNQYGGSSSPSDFTLYVAGATQGQQYITGSQNGTNVLVSGSYAVSVYNQVGYTPTYSSGCSGTVTLNQNAICYVTLTNAYNNNGYQQYPYYQPYVQPYITPVVQTQPAVTVVNKYVPTLPNTGYEPISTATIAFAGILLLAALVLSFPYVRKAFAVILG